jgi:glutamate formiminotransferase/formiminotetrahydrofolate cyclodeaminase
VEATASRFRDLTVDAFVERLASAEPVPGGGSASAVAAAIAAGLVAMVSALSADRPKYAEHAAVIARSGANGRELADRCLRLADDDATAYAGYAAALRLPKETEADQAVRRTAIRDAARQASLIPLEALQACLEVVAGAEALAGRSNANAASDLAVAALLAEAAARGAAANVLVNLPATGDDALAADLAQRTATLVAEVERLAAQTRAVVDSGEVRPPLPVDV